MGLANLSGADTATPDLAMQSIEQIADAVESTARVTANDCWALERYCRHQIGLALILLQN
jgi:hypothetical protein